MKLLCFAVLLAVPSVACAQDAGRRPSANASRPVSFERQVLPLLEKRCNKCHHAGEQQGGLDLTRRETIGRGGDELGVGVIPGKPGASPLIQVLTGQVEPAMPGEGDPLPAAEIDLLRRWIKEGARDDSPEFSRSDIDFFEREIRPVLFAHCFKCHAGDEAESGLRLTSRHGILSGGSRGAAVVPGNARASLLLKAIRHTGDLRMPKIGDRLSTSQVQAFEKWIARGLPWPQHETVLARGKLFTISQADRNHWAFHPLPESLPAKWSIDAVLKTRQTQAGLEPAPEADRHRLLRRVTYDLIGYPPTPDEIKSFVGNNSPDAFEKVVDRLLDSSHFGWRWGRHWLDYTRNGANGQSNRGPVMDPDRYARWVARCFNEDRPYDWFARVHIAGDRMPGFDGSDYSIDQALAAAVPLNGSRTFQNAATETFVLMDKLDEGIEFMGRSLMGISLECARCHDHKFDPISQRDYYALLGIFQSSWFGPVPADVRSRTAADAALARHQELKHELARLNGLIRKAGTVTNVRGGGLVKKWQLSRQAPLAPKEKRGVELEVLILKAELQQAELQRADGTISKRQLDDLRKTITAREASLTDFKARYFYVVAFKELGYELHGHKTQVGLIERATKAGLTEVVRELEELDQFWVDERNRWGERQRFGGYRKKDPEVAEMAAWDDEVQKTSAELKGLEAQQIVVRCEGGLRRAEDLAAFRKEAEDDKRAFYPELLPPYVGDARLLRRGDVLEPDRLIRRGYPQFFGGGSPGGSGKGESSAKGESSGKSDADSGRLELANWLTSPDTVQSSLVARAAANRAWQHLFGEGLCRTPKELGRLGETPEMPELLDGLAARFIAADWSSKSLIREIVLSDAYRQSAVVDSKALEHDPENRLVARQSVRRLECEAIMNTMAYLRHGRRFDDPQTRNANLLAYQQYFQHFDGPTTDDLIERRVASISATQALFLMNNESTTSVIAVDLARRLFNGDSPELLEILTPLYETVLQRPPSDAERSFAEAFVNRRHENGEKDPAADIREFIKLLLCGNEQIYLE